MLPYRLPYPPCVKPLFCGFCACVTGHGVDSNCPPERAYESCEIPVAIAYLRVHNNIGGFAVGMRKI